MEFLKDEAKAAEKGCAFHFMEQATRVKNMIDAERIEDFDRVLHKMVRTTMPDDEFQAVVDSVYRDFPEVWGWFSWWLRPSIIGMIFPSKSSTDPNIAALVPKTSNPVEHSHSLLNLATGKNNGVLEGIQKTFQLAQKFHSEDTAIKGKSGSPSSREFSFINRLMAVSAGYRAPLGPRERKPKNSAKFYHNGGRGPDTNTALNDLEPAKHGFKKLVHLPLFPLMYKWASPNSCFIDHGLELFFRSYYLLDASIRSHYRTLLPSESFAFLLIEHCDLRLQLMTSTKKKSSDATQHLAKALKSFQELAIERVFKKWRPDWNPKAYHSALEWLQPMIEVCLSSFYSAVVV